MAAPVWRIVPVTFGTLTRTGGADFLGRVTKVRWHFNPPNEFEFETSVDDPAMAQITANSDTEVAIYRNGVLLMVGKPTTRRVDSRSRTWTITCKDPMWYYMRRFVGDANRETRITNGDFESGTTAWNKSAGTFNFSTQTLHHAQGTSAAKLTASPAANLNRNIFQTFAVATGRLGLALHLRGWFYIETWAGPAALNLGMLLQRVGATGPGASGFQTITADTPRQTWQRAAVVVNVPPNVTEFVTVALFAIVGVIWWDAVSVTVQEALYYDEDMSTAMADVVHYGEGTGRFGLYAPNKSYLKVNVAFPASTGIAIDRAWPLAEHQPLYEGGTGNGILDEYMKAENGLDLAWDYDTRTIHGYYPKKGQDINTPWVYHYKSTDESFNENDIVVGWTYGDSIEQTANDVVMLGGWGGAGDDPTREEGAYLNASALSGLTLEEVDTAPQGAPIGQLNALARGRGKQVEKAVATPQLFLAERRSPTTDAITYPLVNVVFPGDTIKNLDIQDGNFHLIGEYRIVDLELDVATEILTATINPA